MTYKTSEILKKFILWPIVAASENFRLPVDASNLSKDCF